MVRILGDNEPFAELSLGKTGTPLIAVGEVVGMISTHWRTPHQPSNDDLRQFENLAKRATELIARQRRKAA